MRTIRTLRTPARANLAVAGALALSALAATPLVMGASRALAVSEAPTEVSRTVAVTTVEVGPIRTAPAAEACARKVRVVYTGYGAPADGCAVR